MPVRKMQRYSESDLQRIMANRNRSAVPADAAAASPARVSESQTGAGQAGGTGSGNEKTVGGEMKNYALGRLKTGERNKTEAAYEASLQARKISGEVVWYRFEGIKLRLADNTFYTPDFAVMLASGQIELHEVKGFMQEDANVKIKVAAEMYPFRFVVVRTKPKKEGGGWKVEEF